MFTAAFLSLLLLFTPLQPIGTHVGELQEKWQFPSDHLPIGMTLDDIQIASWNVLNSHHMHWVIEKNSQGLSRSLIADEHVYIGDSGLTLRDQHVLDLVLKMAKTRHIIALQECSAPFLSALNEAIPANFTLIHAGDGIDYNVLIIDSTRFAIAESRSVAGIFSEERQRTFQDLQLFHIESGQPLRVVNAHLPGNPKGPARHEFAQYLIASSHIETIALGDMNFNELEMAEAFKSSSFAIFSPYCTNISPYAFNSKAIDHFMIQAFDCKHRVQINSPEEVLADLGQVAQLL